MVYKHCGNLAKRILAAEGENFNYTPLKDHLEQMFGAYVMDAQRISHRQTLHQPATAPAQSSGASAKIELS